MPAFFRDWIMFAVTALPFGLVCMYPFRHDKGFRYMDMGLALLIFVAGCGAVAAALAKRVPWVGVLAFLLQLPLGAVFFSLMLTLRAGALRWCYVPGMVCAMGTLLISRACTEWIFGAPASGYFSPWYPVAAVPVGAVLCVWFIRMLQRTVLSREPGKNAEGLNILSGAVLAFAAAELTAECGAAAPWRVGAALVCLLGCRAIYQTWGRLSASQQEAGRLRERDAQLEDIIHIQREQYARLSEQVEAARQARHDLRHHLAALRAFVDTGDRRSPREYLEQYGGERAASEPVSWCANRAVDSVAQHYLSRAVAEGARVDVELDIPEDVGIPAPDLCIILGNAIDNAREAVRDVPAGEKLIRIRSEDAPGWLTIVIGNSYSGRPLRPAGDGYLSAKQEGRIGVGLTSIRRIAEKYGGTAEFEAREDLFMTSVMLFKRDGAL